MSVEENLKERAKLFPVVFTIVSMSVVIVVISYFVGNMIYQIP